MVDLVGIVLIVFGGYVVYATPDITERAAVFVEAFEPRKPEVRAVQAVGVLVVVYGVVRVVLSVVG